MRESLENISCPSCGSPHLPVWRDNSWWRVIFKNEERHYWRCQDCGLEDFSEKINDWFARNPKGTLRIWEEGLYLIGSVQLSGARRSL
jgi:hypothetical protein